MIPPLLAALIALMPLMSVPVAAQTPLTAEAFDDYTRGKTLFYGIDGQLYGVERYLEGRRVIWSFLDGDCQEGIWYEERGLICFLYETKSDPQCWSFSVGPNGLIAQFDGSDEATELYEAVDIGEDMLCLGPEVGV